jgi:hypothetical protein
MSPLAMRLASIRTTESFPPSLILGWDYDFKVRWIDAAGVTAEVIDLSTGGDGTYP